VMQCLQIGDAHTLRSLDNPTIPNPLENRALFSTNKRVTPAEVEIYLHVSRTRSASSDLEFLSISRRQHLRTRPGR
jgi:hypothetical protein